MENAANIPFQFASTKPANVNEDLYEPQDSSNNPPSPLTNKGKKIEKAARFLEAALQLDAPSGPPPESTSTTDSAQSHLHTPPPAYCPGAPKEFPPAHCPNTETEETNNAQDLAMFETVMAEKPQDGNEDYNWMGLRQDLENFVAHGLRPTSLLDGANPTRVNEWMLTKDAILVLPLDATYNEENACKLSYPYIPNPEPTPGPPFPPPPESYPTTVRSKWNTTPLATLLLSLLLLLLLLLLMTPPPFHHFPTLLPSALILTFGPDTFPLLHSSTRSSLLSPPSDPLPPNLRQVTTFHCCPIPCTRTPLVPSLRDSVTDPTSDFDSTWA
ncbi:uncharacterized protein EI90DRAFT_3130718 [Cantharellus anzutake]|uniref:uncharacterized protein n=1 Tax=Cantharellus anzutake TaxID=1750568 RepID=UPI001905A1DC|nr:uncharacterized protein EI90DRAFT_3130718 [Cantharellus anzutake]KAF8322920.1 hypothetical protein EI90DRAFT_3130718 [Cantharellus anzutake]